MCKYYFNYDVMEFNPVLGMIKTKDDEIVKSQKVLFGSLYYDRYKICAPYTTQNGYKTYKTIFAEILHGKKPTMKNLRVVYLISSFVPAEAKDNAYPAFKHDNELGGYAPVRFKEKDGKMVFYYATEDFCNEKEHCEKPDNQAYFVPVLFGDNEFASPKLRNVDVIALQPDSYDDLQKKIVPKKSERVLFED